MKIALLALISAAHFCLRGKARNQLMEGDSNLDATRSFLGLLRMCCNVRYKRD